MSSYHPETVERWGLLEVTLAGPTGLDPLSPAVSVVFEDDDASVTVDGFWDGDGQYVIRFSPDRIGTWRFRTSSDYPELDGHEGTFTVEPPGSDNHGPVRVDAGRHFRYEDGTRHVPVGTTCYAWVHQDAPLQVQTLETLESAGFNKLRMCVFPKDYLYNENEPPIHPFATSDDGRVDPQQPQEAFFRHLDTRIGQLRELGIEADVILFHPYDRWGYSEMSEEQDLRYLRYVITRLAAHRNVWWSLANEYDFLLERKPVERWEKFFALVDKHDPYRHLTSIHNGEQLYDHSRPGITHVSIQAHDVRQTYDWRSRWNKPVINDEPEYEGDVPNPWGNISAEELVHRFWQTAVAGGYAGHGETYLHDDDILWWAKGGVLHGESAPRIAFLRQLMESSDAPWEPLTDRWEWQRIGACRAGRGELIIYFGPHQPRFWARGFPEQPGEHRVELIDPWAMTIKELDLIDPPRHRYTPNETDRPNPAFGVELPGRPHLALRVRTA